MHSEYRQSRQAEAQRPAADFNRQQRHEKDQSAPSCPLPPLHQRQRQQKQAQKQPIGPHHCRDGGQRQRGQ